MENKTYSIELTWEEIQTLNIIFNNVGGSPTNSPREHVENMHDKISQLRVKFVEYEAEEVLNRETPGAIYFKPYIVINERLPF